jgi:hypothetical protein
VQSAQSAGVVRPGCVDVVAVAWINRDRDVAAEAFLAEGRARVPDDVDAAHDDLPPLIVARVEQVVELRPARRPVVVAHDDDVARPDGAADRRAGGVDRVHRPVQMNGWADVRGVLVDCRRPRVEPSRVKVRRRRRARGAAVQRHVHGRSVGVGREVVVPDVHAIVSDAGAAHHGRGLHERLVDVRSGAAVDQQRRRGRAREVVRAQNVHPKAERLLEDADVEAVALRPEPQADVAGGGVARHDRV